LSGEQKVTVEVGGRRLTLANLGKVLYPASGTTKAEVIDYYTRIAEVALPHLAGRPLTARRYPDGVDGTTFFGKNAPAHTPAWIRRVRLPSPGSTRDRQTIDYLVVEEVATLVWLANLAALELHVPMWRVGEDDRPAPPDLLVVDLDPGAPAGLVECATVAGWAREALAEDGLTALPKTSGGKGLQLYAALPGDAPWQEIHAYAKRLAERLEGEHPDLVVSRMAKNLRPGKVLVDWSQNNAAKTTVAAYSLRAQPLPTASTPLRWAEVEAVTRTGAGEAVRYLAADALRRVAESGDLFAPLLGFSERPAATYGGAPADRRGDRRRR
jgi:bifunctional non-homologous end joining protein LigD